MRGDPPRHIRDIAHLYLSGVRRPGGAGVRLVVAGVSADVMPGFHVANLALAAAARGVSTRIEERSGLPVNAGCFLGLDPRTWAARANGHRTRVVAFAGVSFERAPPETDRDAAGGAPAEGLEIVHVPPWDTGREHDRALDRAVSRAGRAVLLYLAPDDAEPRPWRETDGHPGVLRRVVYVSGATRAVAGNGCAGVVTRWTRALVDPLPVVVRDPGSRLSRQYRDAVSALLSGTSSAAPPGPRFGPDHALTALEPR
jgi:hypothetical protein